MSSNSATVVDEDGGFPDWIELFNDGGDPVALEGWGLSDDPASPLKWVFPAGVSIDPGERLLVYASGKDRAQHGGWGYDAGWSGSWVGSAAGIWLFDGAGAMAAADSTANANHGTVVGGTRVSVGRAGAMKFDSSLGEHVSVPNSPSVQTTGSMTISMWLNPASLANRQNPWDKAYGGEGTISLEKTGVLNFYWGTAGGNSSPYQAFGSIAALSVNRWTHVALVRDLSAGRLRWYFNGSLVATGIAAYSAATASAAALRIGKGYAGSFQGMIGQTMLLPTALDGSAVETLFQQTRGAYQPLPHTNFSLSLEGEPVVLTKPDGTVADSLPAIELRRDLSYGRAGDGAESFRVFDKSTPFEANGTEGNLGILPAPVFSHAGGFYHGAFNLDLSGEAGAEILYTLDGSEPLESRLSGEPYLYKTVYPQASGDPFGALHEGMMNTRRYDGPIMIADRTVEINRLTGVSTWFARTAQAPAGNVRKATVVRARAVKPGYLSSNVATHSYFVGGDVSERFDLPVISLSTDDANLFDYEKGIYVPGKIADDWRVTSPNYTPSTWAIPANYWQDGDAWERPVHMEVYTPTGIPLLAKNLGVKIHGGASRTSYRKSLRLYARDEYEIGAVDFPLFPGLERKAFPGQKVASFERLLLRNSGNDNTGILFLDAMLQGLVAHLPISTQAWQPAMHYINGESWGLINFRERLDERFIETHYGVPSEQSVILDGWGPALEHGSAAGLTQYSNLIAYAEANNAADPVVWNELVSKIDVDNHALYHAFEIYIAHFDWPFNNIKFWKKTTTAYEPDASYGSDGRWRWMIFDTDLGYRISNVAHNSLARVASPAVGSAEHTSSRLFRGLLKSPEYRRLLINHLADLMNGPLAAQRVAAKIDEYNALLAHSRAEHFQRWQSSGAINGGQSYKDFAAQRPGYVRQHVVSQFGLGGTYPLTLDCPHPERGSIRVNSLVVNADMPGHPNPSVPFPWTGTYFQGVAVELEAVAKPGYRFAGWSGKPEGTPANVEVSASGPETWTALFEAVAQPVAVHAWDFEVEPFAVPSRTTGGATLNATLAGGATWLWNAADSIVESAHLRVNNPLGAELVFALPTVGLTSVSFEFETRRSGQGAGQQTVAYTLDGATWQVLQTYEVQDAVPQRRNFDLSGIAGVADNPAFAMRVVFSRTAAQVAAGTGLAGNNRFDQAVLRALPLPGTNLPPEVARQIGRREVVAAGEAITVDLAGVFSDPNGTGSLTFSADITPAGSAVGLTNGDQLRIEGLVTGNAVVTVSATDGVNVPAHTSFDLLVYPAPAVLAERDYVWRQWSGQEPAGSFPPHMVFLQGEGNDDSTLETHLTRAYEIPAVDAAVPADVSAPYAAVNRTRINGLEKAGVSFINTGRGRDLGSALLALDTRGVDRVKVAWVAGTALPGPRMYALRLQARDGIGGAIQDVMAGGQAVEYVSSATVGHQHVFGPVELPVELLGKANLQLQWRYYLVSGTSGARAQLSLDDLEVTTGSGPRDYESWRLAEYPDLGERDDDAVSGPLAELEGVKNLMRYAWGLGRNTSAAAAMPTLSAEGAFRFRYDPAKRDLVYRVTSSTDLSNWSEVLFDSSRDLLPAPVNDVLELPVGRDGGRRFYRLEVSR